MNNQTAGAPEKHSPMERISAFLVDRRKALYLLYIAIAVFCAFSSGWAVVNEGLTGYLPDASEARQSLAVMDGEFSAFGTSRVMVDNVSFDQADALAEELRGVAGVKSVEFDNTEAHYSHAAALFSITCGGAADDEVSLAALDNIMAVLEGFDVYVAGEAGSSASERLAVEMWVVVAVMAVILLLVLLFTSYAYMELPVVVLVLAAAALMNKGTNFIFGEISFVSDSLAVVLQLALSVNFAAALCRRFAGERERLEARDAAVSALSGAAPEIAKSALPLLAGLAALCFMRLGIGLELGLVLVKAVVLSLLAVFTLLPGLLVSFSGLLDRTRHKSFVPEITAWGRLAVKSRFVLPPLFAVLIIGGFVLAGRCSYVYGQSELSALRRNSAQLAQEKVESVFGRENTLSVLVPQGDYEQEGQLLQELEQMPETDSALGLANLEITEGCMLTDKLTPGQFAEMAGLDVEQVRPLYAAYAADHGNYVQAASGLDSCSVPLIDLLLYACGRMEAGDAALDAETTGAIEKLSTRLTDARLQFEGGEYSRMVLQLNLPEEGERTSAILRDIRETTARYYPEGVLLAGDSVEALDLSAAFGIDHIRVSVLAFLLVILALMLTLRSIGVPVLLAVMVQGGVWINFSLPYLLDRPMFFLTCLVVGAVQLSAGLGGAAAVAKGYAERKRTMSLRDAVIGALDEAFPAIAASGAALAAAGIFLGCVPSDPVVAAIGAGLGRGALISFLLAMGVLPQLLLLSDILIKRAVLLWEARRPLRGRSGGQPPQPEEGAADNAGEEDSHD